ncbi:L-serine dehydratase, iron-sulfur-dependent subunit beta [Clostridium putrefaciens]|uniref:L-serine deaminase n=1 Tax=Clostridium putrefaciens TaxID=99675 RepID=A0A381J7I4_9CLOT|nr:L-serine ammonia-lyase, iron-sulfur-dependent subunit beta [Clostridium putrefaciens]SUY46351.1 L-serine dehydratase, iron-sulfur-dependent subunit beta [Clostridium putrefaciens]
MSRFGVFDILGPIMIGPSSSHTAGAARLAKIAAIISGPEIKEVVFLLHGSFAKTYKGHGTDRALVAGILGMDPDDEKLRYSLEIATTKNIKVSFREADLGDVHPNTVKLLIKLKDDNLVTVMGSSIGGGNIIILEVDEEKLEFTGEYPTLIVKHIDALGLISKVTSLIYEEGTNIASMSVFRSKKGSEATMIFETDNIIPKSAIEKIKAVENVIGVRAINPVKEGE